MDKEYIIKGICIGYPWGNNTLYGYESETYKGTDLNILMDKINHDIKNGSIDSGFGFEKVIGAILNKKTIWHLISDNKDFKHEDNEIIESFIEDIKESDKDFFMDFLYSFNI